MYLRAIGFLLLVFQFNFINGQTAINLSNSTPEHIFKSQEIVFLEDAENKLTFEQISGEAYKDKFQANKDYYPKNYNKKASYWYRISVRITEDIERPAIIEFFDQITNSIDAYFPKGDGSYTHARAGANFNFKERLYQHKNFEFFIKNLKKGEYYYYFKVKSKERVNVIIVFRTVERFIQYGLTEYLTYGLFYGMIFIFSFHNLLMYLAVRRRQYLYYILYIISVGLYETSTDGIAYQYLWPQHPVWNDYAYGIALFCISLFALIFTKELLHVKQKAPLLNRVINVIILLRSVYFLTCLVYQPDWFRYKYIEFIPLVIAFYTGVYIWWKKKYGPARFFVLGYSFLFLGFTVKIIHILGYARHIPGVLGFYSLSFGFLLEMVFLSFAIGDQVRILKRKKEKAQKQIIRQMQLNVKLKDELNKELEAKVDERTREVKEQAKALMIQNETIEQQNGELIYKNSLLQHQSEEISRMNALLERDNVSLKTSIEKVTDARIEATEMDFEEFSLKYPDKESCHKFLANLKWQNGYVCTKCGNTNYCGGKAPYNRRCTKCAYEESVLHHTIFENNKIPINKAFYLVYLMYNSKGSISSHKLSESLGIRQSTCWAYAVKVKKVMDERKKDIRGTGKSGWSKLILDKK